MISSIKLKFKTDSASVLGGYVVLIEQEDQRIRELVSNPDWFNGYVLIKPSHPMYDVGYESLDVLVHGGLTFGCKFENINEDHKKDLIEFFGSEVEDCYVYGFDTQHSGDTIEKWNLTTTSAETVVLATQFMEKE